MDTCKRCGRCCISVPCDFILDDIERAAAFKKLTVVDFFNAYLCVVVDEILCSDGDYDREYRIMAKRKGGDSLQEDYDAFIHDKINPCIFYDEENKACTIYDSRPLIAAINGCYGTGPQLSSTDFWLTQDTVNTILKTVGVTEVGV